MTSVLEWSDALWGNNVTEESEGGNSELRHVHVNLYAVVLQAGEVLMTVLSVRCSVVRRRISRRNTPRIVQSGFL